MFFVVSTGRSGSKTIARLLSLVDGCTCLHEPAPQLIRESSAYRYGELEAASLAGILRASRQPRLNGAVYGESNQTLSLIIPVLAQAFAEARFIWLVRNGLDMVASAYAKQWYSGHSEQHDRYEDCTPLEKVWIDGRIEGDRCGDVSSQAWARMDRFARCCWYWRYVNQLIETDLKAHAPGRSTLLRLESLDHDLRTVVRWLGLRAALVPTAKRMNVGKREPYPWTSWTTHERAVFEEWCGDLMDAHYPAWRTPGGKWLGVSVEVRTDWLARPASIHRLVRHVNRLLSANRVP